MEALPTYRFGILAMITFNVNTVYHFRILLPFDRHPHLGQITVCAYCSYMHSTVTVYTTVTATKGRGEGDNEAIQIKNKNLQDGLT